MNTELCLDCSCHSNTECLNGGHPLVGDGYCHDELNTLYCIYDGGDCCLSIVNIEHCTDCTCHHQQTCLAGVHPLIRDGYCHDEVNNVDCSYDGGDCCGSCIVLEYCTECACNNGNIDANVTQNPLVGDDYCHDEVNNLECNYDGGDCCSNSDLIGNGFCNDEINNGACNFDGGDCCVNVNTGYCSECICHELGSGVITSPGFPGYYGNYLDLTWLIQAPLGQLIELSFLHFDVEFYSVNQ